MPVTTPDLFWLVGQEVLDCVCAGLEAQSECGCPCRAMVVHGPAADDECCDGQLTVSLERVYVSNAFPSTETNEIICSSQLAADYTVRLVRCVPVVDDNGVAPSPQALSDSARQINQDFYISIRAVICCLAAYKKYRRFTMRDMRPVGPQGGCGGFEIKFSVELVDPIPVVGG